MDKVKDRICGNEKCGAVLKINEGIQIGGIWYCEECGKKN